MQQYAAVERGCRVGYGLPTFGIQDPVDLEVFWKLLKISVPVPRGRAIINSAEVSRGFTLLLDGSAMSYQHKDGARHLHRIHHPGDFLALHSFLYKDSKDYFEVEASTTCSVGTIDEAVLEEALQRHPALAHVLWRAAVTEATIRQRLTAGRQMAFAGEVQARRFADRGRDAVDADESLSRWDIRLEE